MGSSFHSPVRLSPALVDFLTADKVVQRGGEEILCGDPFVSDHTVYPLSTVRTIGSMGTTHKSMYVTSKMGVRTLKLPVKVR